MATAESPYNKARSIVTRKGCSLHNLKGELRKQFKNRLRDLRSKSVDEKRNMTPADISDGYKNWADSLRYPELDDDDVRADEVGKILKEIHDELLQELANDFEKHDKDTIQSIVDNLLTCKICEQYSEVDICYTCNVQYFSH